MSATVYGESLAGRFRATAKGFVARMIGDLIEAFKALATGFANSTGDVKVAAVRSFVYFAFFLIVYTTAFMIRTGSISTGAVEAYKHSWLSPSSEPYTQVHSQAALAASLKADRVITGLLNELQTAAPGSARSRLAVIHDGIASITGIDLLRFDVTNVVAAPGRDSGALMTNEPLSDWSPDYTPAMLAHRCAMNPVSQMVNAIRRSRLEKMGTAWTMGCPVVDIDGRIFGSVFTAWDSGDVPPTGDALKALMEKQADIGRRIGIALDVRHAEDDASER